MENRHYSDILFSGERVGKDIHGWGYHKFMFFHPHILQEGDEIGMGFNLFDRNSPDVIVGGDFVSFPKPVDLVAGWRALKIAEKIPALTENDFHHLYPAALQDTYQLLGSQSEIDTGVLVVTVKTGLAQFQEILNAPIPAEVRHLISRGIPRDIT